MNVPPNSISPGGTVGCVPDGVLARISTIDLDRAAALSRLRAFSQVARRSQLGNGPSPDRARLMFSPECEPAPGMGNKCQRTKDDEDRRQVVAFVTQPVGERAKNGWNDVVPQAIGLFIAPDGARQELRQNTREDEDGNPVVDRLHDS
jgi:hypothetical protein